MKNPVEVVGDFALILLRKGKRTFIATVDADDLSTIGIYSWHVNIQKNGKPRAYCSFWRDGGHRHAYMHHLVVPKASAEIDHANGDSLDNRRSNLRRVTRARNMQNMAKHRGETRRVPGVFWHTVNNAWFVRRMVNGVYIYAGYNYKKKSDAIAAARKLYGIE